jgi:hypothetical protein
VVLDGVRFVPFILDAKCVLMSFSVTMFVFGTVAIEVWDTQFPVWAFVLSLAICTFYFAFVMHFLPKFNTCLCFSVRVYCPYWCDPGYYEPASWA